METSAPAAAADGGTKTPAGATCDITSAVRREQHFDHLAANLGVHFHETLGYLRQHCPVTHSDRHGGFWVVTGYDEVTEVLRDWRTYSNAQGVAIPMALSTPPLPPDEYDPPLQRVFKRLLNAYLTPAKVAPYEQPTRELANRLIDEFIDEGRCEFMEAFAHHLPRLSFFDLVMHAPADEVAQLNAWTRIVTGGSRGPEYDSAQSGLIAWLEEFIAERRRRGHAQDDIVDAIVHADIEGRPITKDEIVGTLQLLMFGGFETTSAALGNIVIWLALDRSLPDLLRMNPALIPRSLDEFLRIDAPVTCMARAVVRDTVLGGRKLRAGDKVLFSLAAANRDPREFDEADELVLDRATNRHVAFGAGPHRCAGSNLARLNLRVALAAITRRLHDIRLQDDKRPIEYETAFNRSPVAVPIAFAAGG